MLRTGQNDYAATQGGIHEQNGRFKVAHDRTFTTYLRASTTFTPKIRLRQSSRSSLAGIQKQFG